LSGFQSAFAGRVKKHIIIKLNHKTMQSCEIGKAKVVRLKKKIMIIPPKVKKNSWMIKARYNFNDGDKFTRKLKEKISASTTGEPHFEVIFDDGKGKDFALSFEVKIYYCKKDKTFYYVFPDAVYDMIFREGIIPGTYLNMRAVEFANLPIYVVKVNELKGVVINKNSDFEFFVGGIFYKKFRNESYNRLFFKEDI
jgi:hypothetical protein